MEPRDFIPQNMRKSLKRILIKTPFLRNHPSIIDPVDRSDRYLIALKQVAKTGSIKDNLSFEKLHQCFKKYGVRSDRLPKNWWMNFVMLANKPDAESSDLSKEMINRTKNFDPKNLTRHEWTEIYLLCIRVGLFHIGYIIRDLSRKRSIISLEYTQKIKEKKSSIAAAIELQEYDKAFNTLDTISKTGKEPVYCNNLKVLLNRLTGLPIKQMTLKNVAEQNFLNYVYEKTVAVVGPASSDAMDAEEIDSFDRVVRINYIKKGKGCDPIYNGLRCDITYFNLMQAEYFINNSKNTLPEDLSWLVLKHHKHVLKKLKNTNSRINLRQLKEYNKSFNMIPNSIFDLIYFNPKQIKIFHADLMLTPNRFSGYYPKEFNRDDKKFIILRFCRFATIHDPVAQYTSLYSLWQARLIVGDNRFNKVMKLGCEDYMRKLQEIYGDHARLNLQGV